MAPSFSHLVLSPQGRVYCSHPEHPLQERFERSQAEGLFVLGASAENTEMPPGDRFWQGYVSLLIRAVCHLPEGVGEDFSLPPPERSRLTEIWLDAPPLPGGEYLSNEILEGIWDGLAVWTREQVATLGSVSTFLHRYAPNWTRVGRVTVHLAENKGDPDYPFAFMASYASGLHSSGRLRQLPLGKALEEYGKAKDKATLLKLLEPLHRASQACAFMAELVEEGDVYHPLAWSPAEAHRFLQSIPAYENAGLLVRLPDWWRKRSRRPRVSATVGEKKNVQLGLDALLDFKLEVEVDGQNLSRKEVESLLSGEEGLVLFRGKWIEVDRERLQQALDHWKAVAADGTLTFAEGMRLLADNAPLANEEATEENDEQEREWAFARPGEGLATILRQLAQPETLPPPGGLKAKLRPYQIQGFSWLWFCAQTGLGACLADDMGLGKTVQVLAALQYRKEKGHPVAPALLVVPASLIGNWKREAARFTPDLRLYIAHRSDGETDYLNPSEETLAATDMVVTTYGMLTRLPWPAQTRWSWVILDEAQAIKNHSSRQSKAVRKLTSETRFALTGTPIENHLGDLWSLFDFINPGLLGGPTDFKNFTKRLRGQGTGHFGPLRRLVSPYILRRLKTDRSIINDLPEKTEMKVFCGLTTAQAKLYTQTATQLKKELEQASGIQRRGLVLAYLMRFKQICNHPDHLTQTGEYAPAASGKFTRLAELTEEIGSRGEKVLVFTQFREMTNPLEQHLASIFGRGGLVLHGGTAVKQRQKMVDAFQSDSGPPFFILSLKAGGTGLNLTSANHVIHFDRWWNPAVENQATDRAFRIGQKRNVVVHKFVTSGTLEEKIDALITEKQETAEAILKEGAEKNLTEMSDTELLDFIRLDIKHSQTNL